jgi:ABC-type molybdate transport system substrate-binding protein
LQILAAGSLREAIGEIGAEYGKAAGVTVKADFGPSGVLRERAPVGLPAPAP